MTMLPYLMYLGGNRYCRGHVGCRVKRWGFRLHLFHSIQVFCGTEDISAGIIKSVIFGMIVALVGCDRGMTCDAGAEGVGKATTQSVVYSIVMLFAANYLLSSVLF